MTTTQPDFACGVVDRLGQHLQGRVLQVGVDGQGDVHAVDGRRLVPGAARDDQVPGVDVDDPLAVLAGQLGVELGLDAGQPVAVVVGAADQRRGGRAVRVLPQVLTLGDDGVAVVDVEQRR